MREFRHNRIYELDPNAAVEAVEQVQHARARRLIWPAVVALILLLRVVTLNSCIREEHFRPKELK